ncbi:hypothetical protein [Pararhodobacter zhoushanensis]|uniref:hypothetical protein n=1 Tax=Pararhodobacter zhoushanensis TaxID=2479545 RepID=UPI000F8E54A5|nr:hypothetical protein [Pararhodobacter zhoushanensis]
MINEEEQAAYLLAKKMVLQAVSEQWSYVCLSPLFQGDGNPREGFAILKDLTVLPDEVRHLTSGVFIELRGTGINDLRPLANLGRLGQVNFEGIPAAENDAELQMIATTTDVAQRSELLQGWLDANKVADPPEVIEGGPEFIVDDHGPIKLVDVPLVESDDEDQVELQEECKRKVEELLGIVDLAANVAPNLLYTAKKYREMIGNDASSIGARKIWSLANSLEATLEVHDHAVKNDRASDELPSTVAAKLADLAETHRVWFLGHPGAREVEQRASRHANQKDGRERRKAAITIVEAAESSNAVADDATSVARENIQTSDLDTPAGVAALGELEEWAWNFVASVVRKAWRIAKDPPGGFVSHTVAGHYLLLFLTNNDQVIGQYLQNVMSQSPLWWEMFCNSLRRLSQIPEKDKE